MRCLTSGIDAPPELSGGRIKSKIPSMYFCEAKNSGSANQIGTRSSAYCCEKEQFTYLESDSGFILMSEVEQNNAFAARFHDIFVLAFLCQG